MNVNTFKTSFIFLVMLLAFTAKVPAQVFFTDGQMEVTMRMIGHKILLSAGDSVSRVLPIEKIDNRYRIQFKEEFEFEPELLAGIIEEVVEEKNLVESYLVEVQKCDSNTIVYSYYVGVRDEDDVVPCRARLMPKGCYQIYFTNLDEVENLANAQIIATNNEDKSSSGLFGLNNFMLAGLLISLFIFVVWIVKRKKKITHTEFDPNKIHLGSFTFDKRNMQLSSANETIELTSKEADLLYLLHTSVNNTIEREIILKAVWGDEGDYVGRTLDVFISKLRKKLEADARIKIVNTRGIGYKLILNE